MDRLIPMAQAMGLYVTWRPIRRPLHYISNEGLVILSSMVQPSAVREALAHEMGHVHHGHEWTHEHEDVLDELQADRFAACLLIPQFAFDAACERVGPGVDEMARALGVSIHLMHLRHEDVNRDVSNALSGRP